MTSLWKPYTGDWWQYATKIGQNGGPNLNQMVEYIFRMVDVYNLYGARAIAKYETSLNIERYYPIQEDEDKQKRIDMEEVIADVRSGKSYMKRWLEVGDLDAELEQIQLEKQLLQDSYTSDLNSNINLENE